VEKKARIDSIDLLRGIVIVFMALDHTRSYFHARIPGDLTETALFMTRWITHFCAPTFVLLAGLSSYLYGSSKGRSKKDLSRFLLTRGFWIILMELTIVRFGWFFLIFDASYFQLQVMWAIGISMICMAALIHLPLKAIAAFSLILIFGHDFFDFIQTETLGRAALIWNFLHEHTILEMGAGKIEIYYPIIPWPGIMALGYVIGPLFKQEPAVRRRFLIRAGAAITAGFVLLRLTNLYGDPGLWSVQGSFLATLLSFINCEKYPPSLLFLMMTLGPALILLALLESMKGRFAGIFTTFGRVPFLFYIVHLPFIHIIAGALAWVRGAYFMEIMFNRVFIDGSKPLDYGVGLLTT